MVMLFMAHRTATDHHRLLAKRVWSTPLVHTPSHANACALIFFCRSMAVEALILTICELLREGNSKIQFVPDCHCAAPLSDYTESD